MDENKWDEFCKEYIRITYENIDKEADALIKALSVKKKKVSFKFAWYDLWIGLFYDRKNKIIYICPIPTFLITIRI